MGHRVLLGRRERLEAGGLRRGRGHLAQALDVQQVAAHLRRALDDGGERRLYELRQRVRHEHLAHAGAARQAAPRGDPHHRRRERAREQGGEAGDELLEKAIARHHAQERLGALAIARREVPLGAGRVDGALVLGDALGLAEPGVLHGKDVALELGEGPRREPQREPEDGSVADHQRRHQRIDQRRNGHDAQKRQSRARNAHVRAGIERAVGVGRVHEHVHEVALLVPREGALRGGEDFPGAGRGAAEEAAHPPATWAPTRRAAPSRRRTPARGRARRRAAPRCPTPRARARRRRAPRRRSPPPRAAWTPRRPPP